VPDVRPPLHVPHLVGTVFPVTDTAACSSCGAPVIFVPVHKQAGGISIMPLNATPDPSGNVIVGPSGMARAGRIRRKDEQPAPHEEVYLPHFATCTKPGAHRTQQAS
jgi:hypothetical protein